MSHLLSVDGTWFILAVIILVIYLTWAFVYLDVCANSFVYSITKQYFEEGLV